MATRRPLKMPDHRLRDGDPGVVERLVRRLVVDGVPAVGAERLLHRIDLAALGHRPADVRDVRAIGWRLHVFRGALVADLEGVPAVLGEHPAGVHHQVLAGVAERDRAPVEAHAAHAQRIAQVELQPALVDRGPEQDGRLALQLPCLRCPAQPEPVVQRVDARVALRRVVGVLDGCERAASYLAAAGAEPVLWAASPTPVVLRTVAPTRPTERRDRRTAGRSRMVAPKSDKVGEGWLSHS